MVEIENSMRNILKLILLRLKKGNEGSELLVECPHEKEHGYRAEQVLSPCQPTCASGVLPRRRGEGPRGCADAPRRGMSTS